MKKITYLSLSALAPLLFIFFLYFPSANAQVSPSLGSKSTVSIKLFPNPAKEILSVTLGNNILSKVDFVVYNSLGGEISRKTESTEDSNEVKINIASLRNGLYFLKITVDHQTFTRSFLKE
jgi:hypothetical protein